MAIPWTDPDARTDWVSFGLTFGAALLLYLVTLAPDVTLGFSGIFATGGMYGGVPHPPGYPLSTFWAWLFIHLLPFGNIAWRVGVSSAVAGALACGVIAFIVSRGGADLLRERGRGTQSCDERQQRPLRVVCGFAAGMIFGANGAFWQRALIADSWTLSILMLCIVLCLLMCWSRRPERRRFLYAAAFAYGLTLTNSQIQLAFAPAIPFLVWAGDRRVGRDMFLTGLLLFLGSLGALAFGRIPLLCDEWNATHHLFRFVVIVGVITSGCGLGLTMLTGRVFTEWKVVLASGLVFLLGLSFYFYVPAASMTNPPMNWGYPRTVAGFEHVISRGQYERIHPTETLPAYALQVRGYLRVSAKEFGWPFMGVALIPVLLMPWLSARMRSWMLSLVVAFLSLTLLLLAILNPAVDRQSVELNAVFYSSSHVVMSLWLGYGLTLLWGRSMVLSHETKRVLET